MLDHPVEILTERSVVEVYIVDYEEVLSRPDGITSLILRISQHSQITYDPGGLNYHTEYSVLQTVDSNAGGAD